MFVVLDRRIEANGVKPLRQQQQDIHCTWPILASHNKRMLSIFTLIERQMKGGEFKSESVTTVKS